MVTDLKAMSRKELEKHLADVKKALQAAQARDRREALKAAEKAAAEYGFSLGEISGTEADQKNSRKSKDKRKRSGPVSPPKFADPADPNQTWTGKGRQPNWYRREIEKGTPPDAMLI